MLNLNGILPTDVVAKIMEYTRFRLKEGYHLATPEALAICEQNYLDEESLKSLCEEAYGEELVEPLTNYVPEDIIASFRGTGAVPVAYIPMGRHVQAVYLPEYPVPEPFYIPNYKVLAQPTTLHYFLEHYQQHYGRHPMLQTIPSKLIFDSIVQEAISLGAADITISTVGKSASVYYNVRKKKVRSKRMLAAEDVSDIVTYLCIRSPYDWGSRTPKYVDVDFTKDYRGRVVINTKYKGRMLTIRLLPSRAFGEKLGSLGYDEGAAQWLRESMMDSEPGLRLIVGETMSGKNTTALSMLGELVAEDSLKVVSVEMPVEQELIGIEQINCETAEDYRTNIQSLIHQNPDFVYITEIRDTTGLDTIRIANTGKRVLSTLHANSVADTLSRMVDITGLGLDRVVQAVHSILWQKLVRDEKRDELFPVYSYIRLTDDLKYKLYGKALGEVIKVIKDEESGLNGIRGI